ncbi:MAG: hypothetical protein R3E32_24555 [Chitinophagales bacterium]
MIDRSMRAMNRHANNSQMFHGDVLSTTHNFRVFALFHNFSPSCVQAWDESALRLGSTDLSIIKTGCRICSSLLL